MIPIGFRELAGVFPTSSHPHFISQKMWAMKGQEKESRQAGVPPLPNSFKIFCSFGNSSLEAPLWLPGEGKSFASSFVTSHQQEAVRLQRSNVCWVRYLGSIPHPVSAHPPALPCLKYSCSWKDRYRGVLLVWLSVVRFMESEWKVAARGCGEGKWALLNNGHYILVERREKCWGSAVQHCSCS